MFHIKTMRACHDSRYLLLMVGTLNHNSYRSVNVLKRRVDSEKVLNQNI